MLHATASRQPFFGCFGLHEWAMLYSGRMYGRWTLSYDPNLDRIGWMIFLILSAVMRRCWWYKNVSYLILVSQRSKSEVWDEAPRPSIASIPRCHRWERLLPWQVLPCSFLISFSRFSFLTFFWLDLNRFWHVLTVYDVTDSAVEVSSALRCTHYDAFRFFHPSAQPMNSVSMLTRDFQQENEQPGMPVRTVNIFYETYNTWANLCGGASQQKTSFQCLYGGRNWL